MSIQIANTGLGNSFDTWRLNTNQMATIMGNNVVTVATSDSSRKNFTEGDGHIIGTFTAEELRASEIKGGNTSVDGHLTISGNTTIGGDGLGTTRSLTIHANTTISGNLIVDTVGQEVFKMGSIERIRVNGGTTGQFLQLRDRNDTPDFKDLVLRDITDLSTNSAHIILSAANTTFSDNGDSPKVVFSTTSGDRIEMFLAKAAGVGDSDLYLKLVDTVGDSVFAIVDSGNNIVAQIDSTGEANYEGRMTAVGFTTEDHILPTADDQQDLGSSTLEFKDAYIDGVAYVDELSLGTAATQGVSTSIIPKIHDTVHIGSATRRWRNSYFTGNMQANNVYVRKVGIGGDLTANGLSKLSNTTVTKLNANNEVYFHGNLTVDGVSSLSNTTVTKLNANNEVYFHGNLQVQGVSSLSNTTVTLFTANNNATFNGDRVTVSGNTFLQTQLTVTDKASFNGDVNLGSATDDTITIKGNFANQHTEGRATFSDYQSGGVGIGTIPDTGYDLHVKRDAKIGRNLDVVGQVGITGDLTIGGNITLSNESGTVLQAQDFETENLHVSGNSYLGSGTSDLIYFNGVANSSLLIATGTRHNIGTSASRHHMIYANNVTVDDTITTKDLDASGNLDIAGNTDVSGAITNDGTTLFGNNGKLHANNVIQNGNITTSMLANTAIASKFDGTNGVENDSITSGTFGSGSLVPVITVNNKGQITAVTNTAVAGVTSFSFSGQEFRNFTIGTADGQNFVANIAAGSISTNTLAVPVDADGNSLTNYFNGTNTVQTFGSSTKIPQIQVNSKGQVVKVANVNVAGVSSVAFTQANSNLRISTADGGTFDVNIHDGQPSKLEGTSSEVTVTAKTDDANTYVIGLPDDVTIAGQLNVSENVVIAGNLIVQGAVSEVSTTNLEVEDNVIKLNKGETGAGVTDTGGESGLEIDRGSLRNVRLVWNEAEDVFVVRNQTDNHTLNIEANNFFGNANTATKLETARNFALTGDVTATAVSFDGSSGVSLTTDISADIITSTELKNSVALKIYNSAGTLQKTIYGAGE